jgi:hypothetical protein
MSRVRLVMLTLEIQVLLARFAAFALSTLYATGVHFQIWSERDAARMAVLELRP